MGAHIVLRTVGTLPRIKKIYNQWEHICLLLSYFAGFESKQLMSNFFSFISYLFCTSKSNFWLLLISNLTWNFIIFISNWHWVSVWQLVWGILKLVLWLALKKTVYMGEELAAFRSWFRLCCQTPDCRNSPVCHQ